MTDPNDPTVRHVHEGSVRDVEALAGSQYSRESDDSVLAYIIPYRNPTALIAYYLGVFSLIPFFPIGLAALVLGIMGLRCAGRRPEAHGRVHAWIGILVGGGFGMFWSVATAPWILMVFAPR